MDKIILHVDFDSFFASVVQQDHPEYRGKPIGITASNGRTAIIAASREAKRRGVKSPSRSFEAQQICPDLMLVKADFFRYLEISKQFLAIATQYSDVVEMFSIDEVFMDVTLTQKLFGGVESLVEKMKAHLARTVGPYITVSVGASYNKMLAKLASGTHKPDGYYMLTPENRIQTYTECDLSDICGIGRQTYKHLNRIGVYKLTDLIDFPIEKLIQEFGNVEGHFLKNVGLGIDTSDITPYWAKQSVKSVGRQYCLPYNQPNMTFIDTTIFELAEEVGYKLRRLNKKAHSVGFSLYGDGGWHHDMRTSDFIDSGKQIYDIYKHCMDRYQHLTYVRRVGVWTGNLVDSATTPQSLFEENRKWDKVYKTLDALTAKFGDGVVRNGLVHFAPRLKSAPNGFMGDKWERTQLAESFEY